MRPAGPSGWLQEDRPRRPHRRTAAWDLVETDQTDQSRGMVDLIDRMIYDESNKYLFFAEGFYHVLHVQGP